MKRSLAFAPLAAVLLLTAAGCAKAPKTGVNDANKRYFDAWVTINCPDAPETALEVDDPQCLLASLPPDLAVALRQSLSLDPRPHYQEDPERRYAMLFGGYEVKFHVVDKRLIVDTLDSCESSRNC